MDDREIFCMRHRAEFPTFMRVLGAMPVDQFAYRPHERSPSALDLVWTLDNEIAACTTMIDSGEVRWDPPRRPFRARWDLIPWASTAAPMMRSGNAAVSSELLTREQQQRIDRQFMADLRTLGSDFPYEEFCDVSLDAVARAS